MEIFEAINVCSTLREDPSGKPDYTGLFQVSKVTRDIEQYRRLTASDGRALALAALELFDRHITGANDFERMPQNILAHLAKIVPGALAGLYPLLLERGIFWRSGVLYREADNATRDQLITLLQAEHRYSTTYSNLLCALAWIGDTTVQDLFREWYRYDADAPSGGGRFPHVIDDFTEHAGWELTEPGRRNLYYQECYELIPPEEAEDIPGPVSVLRPHEEQCRWCGETLATLFEIDLRDPRMAFLDFPGEQLRIAFCPNCSLSGPLTFTDVDGHGGSRWSAINKRPTRLIRERDDLKAPWPQERLVLGPRRRTPFETINLFISKGTSQFGGFPEWPWCPRYLSCPLCERMMTCVGQVNLADLFAGRDFTASDAMASAMLCASCGKSTVVYQKTFFCVKSVEKIPLCE